MSLSLAIALNALADLGIIALLGFAMSRPARLTPHAAVIPVVRQPASRGRTRQYPRRGLRAGAAAAGQPA